MNDIVDTILMMILLILCIGVVIVVVSTIQVVIPRDVPTQTPWVVTATPYDGR